jgi:hypothetical protein
MMKAMLSKAEGVLLNQAMLLHAHPIPTREDAEPPAH